MAAPNIPKSLNSVAVVVSGAPLTVILIPALSISISPGLY